jgi:anti-sigma regulatory factor (Ser/Thr protein kinase)
MTNIRAFSIFTLRLRHERHVVHARQRAREIAALLGFEHQEQIRLATAASELARNAFRYAVNGTVEFLVQDANPQLFMISVTDSGPGIPNLSEILDGRYVSQTGLGKGIIGTKRLMDHFQISSSAEGTRVEAGKLLPQMAPLMNADRIRSIASDLATRNATDPFDEVERQNQELLKTLAELREKQDQLAELNRELEDTNRGVVALYAELDQNADDLRRVSELKTSFLSNLSHEFRTPLNHVLVPSAEESIGRRFVRGAGEAGRLHSAIGSRAYRAGQ